MKKKIISTLCALSITVCSIGAMPFVGNVAHAEGTRQMENLGRGVVAVRKSNNEVFVSWRLLALDDQNIGFNVYRKTKRDKNSVKLNSEVITGATNFIDTTADMSIDNTYLIRSVINGKQQSASTSFTLKANSSIYASVSARALMRQKPKANIWADQSLNCLIIMMK